MYITHTLATIDRHSALQAFPNPEDCSSPGLYHGGIVTFADSDVERVRRAHRNDLENVGLFLVVAHFYLMTDPSLAVATNLIRSFACLRFCHTLIYLNRVSTVIENCFKNWTSKKYQVHFKVPQPARFVAFIGGLGITLYMSAVTIYSNM